MDRAFGRVLGALSVSTVLLLALAPIGCLRETPAPDVAPPVDDSGSLMRFVHVDDAAWLHVDVRRAMQNETLAALWEDLNTEDPVSELLNQADELMLVWTDAFLEQRVAIVRGPMDRQRIDNEARSGRRWSRSPMQSSLSGTTKVWKDATTERALAVPAPNLLVAGDYDHVLTAVARARAGVDEFDWEHIADGQYQIGPLHRAWLQRQLPEPTHAWVARLADSRVALLEDEGTLKLQIRLEFYDGTSLTELIPLVAIYAELAFAVALPEAADELAQLVEIGISPDADAPTLLLEMPIPAVLIQSVLTNALPIRSADVPTPLAGSGTMDD
jgi:hypothetical protein